LIDWCFTPTLAIFQLYRGVIELVIMLITYIPLKLKWRIP